MHAGRVERGFELVEEAFADVVKVQPGPAPRWRSGWRVAGWPTCGAGALMF